MSGICGTFQRVGLWIHAKGEDGKPKPATRRFVYIWQYASGSWSPIGLFLSDGNGELYNVEEDVRKEYLDSQSSPNSAQKTSQTLIFLNAKGPAGSVPDRKKHKPFSPIPSGEYFFCFLPLDLLLRSGYRGNHANVKKWAEENAPLLKEPPKHWLDAVESYGVRTKITEKELTTGIVLPFNWCEWLKKLGEILDKLEWYTNYATARKQPYLQAMVYLDTISNMLEGTAKVTLDTELAKSAKAMSRDYALYHLDAFSQRIHDKYLSKESLQKEQLAYYRFSQQVLAILNDKSFKKSFLYFALADRRCDGSRAYSMQSQSNSAVELDPIHFMNIERVDQIICTAFAATMFDPTDKLVRLFYEQTILPVELKLADTLDNDEREAIKNLFKDPQIEAQFLSGCTPSQKKTLHEAIASGCENLANSGHLTALEKIQPGIRKAIEDMEPKNPIWNWIKDSGKDSIDNFLGIFLAMRESWATESFGGKPKLKAPFIESIKKSVFLIKVATAGYKVYQKKSGGTAGGAMGRSMKEYLTSVKDRMVDKDRWIKDENGNRFGATPQNLNMVFSAIGVVVSIQGIYSFGQKLGSDKKPEIDDYVDLYKSLSSGVSSVLGLLPEGAVDSHLLGALGRVFVPLSVACDLTATIKLVKKSQLYYAQHRFDQSIYAAIKASMQFGSMGFSIASLFQTKFITKVLLKREVLLGGGSRMLSYSFTFATVGCSLFGMYLKSIEPDGSKAAKEFLSKLDELINDDPRKKLDTISEEAHGVTLNVPKINCWESDLAWKDSPTFKGKEIYCDPSRNWGWPELRDLIDDKLAGVPPLMGMGWVTNFDKEKALFELLDRGVDTVTVGKICKKTKNEIEMIYRQDFQQRQKSLSLLKGNASEKGLQALLASKH